MTRARPPSEPTTQPSPSADPGALALAGRSSRRLRRHRPTHRQVSSPTGGTRAREPAKPHRSHRFRAEHSSRRRFDPALVANAVFSEALVRVAMVVKPKAAAAVATTFSFPLVLMIAVLTVPAGPGLPRRARSEVAEGASLEGGCRARVPGRGTPVSGADRAISTRALRLRGAQRPDGAPARPALRDGRDRRRLGGPPARGRRRSTSRRSGRHLRLPRRVDGPRGHPPAIGAIRVRAADLPAPVRRALPRVRDVRHGRHAESDPLPGLPRSGRRLAPGLVSDGAQDRALAFAASVRRPLRSGRPARPADRGHAGERDRVRPDAGPQRHVVLAVRDRDLGLLGAQRARASPASRRPPVDGRDRRPARRRERPARAVAAGPGRPRRALRVQARASSSAPPTARCSRWPRTARRTCRRPRPTPTGSSVGRGTVARCSPSAGSIRPSTRSSPRPSPARAT